MSAVYCTIHEHVCWAAYNISEDDSPEAVNVHVLKQPVQISHWRHATCHCINRALHACIEKKGGGGSKQLYEMYYFLQGKCKRHMHVYTIQGVY